MFDPLQSAYRDKHSTETVLIKVQNDILSALDAGSSAILLITPACVPVRGTPRGVMGTGDIGHPLSTQLSHETSTTITCEVHLLLYPV